jgi:iron(III) transport system permease protein
MVPAAVLAALLGIPLLLIVSMAFNRGDPEALPPTEFGVEHILEMGEHLDWIANSLIIAGGATLVSVLLGTALAWILNRTTAPGRTVFEMLITLPYPLGPLVGGLAWSILGSPHNGLLNQAFSAVTGLPGPVVDVTGLGGIIFVMGIFETPVAVLIIGAAMRRMDPSLEECSAVMGASMLRTALRVTLPLMLPAILSASLFLFTAMLGSFAIPAILGAQSRTYVVTTAIYVLFQGYPPAYPLASALGLVLIAITAAAVWLHGRVLRGRSFVVVGGKNYRPRLIDLGRWTWLLVALECLYVLVALVLPLAVLVLASLQVTGNILGSPADWTLSNYRYVVLEFSTTRQAILNSLWLGAGTATIGVALCTALAIAVHRFPGWQARLLEQVVMLPQAFPRLIFAFGFLWMILLLPIGLYGTLASVLLAYLLVFLPLGYRGMSGVVVQIDRSLEEAARVSGAGRARASLTITVPLLRPGIAATWGLLFMVAIAEVSASVFLATGGTQMLGPAILSFWESGGLPHVSALVIVQSLLVLALMFGVSRVSRGTAVG